MTGVILSLTALVAEVDAVFASGQAAASITPARVNQLEEDMAATVASWSGSTQRTLNALNIATVTTGGTAVTALNANTRTAGGWIKNPETAVTNLGINEIGTASGTASSGSTTFISPGETYMLSASVNAVSVISSDSAHPFAGTGWV